MDCEQDFRNHMLIPNDPSEERDNCNTCLDGFDNQYDMYKHLHYNHLCERPYKCDACLATFVYPNHLKFHLHIHTKLEPYFCEICGEVFKTKISKNKHTMCKHDFIKPYECTICHKSYMRQSKLFKHMRKQGHRSLTLIEKTLEVLIE
ncbi:PREDICTED: zinc finger protein 195-like [Cyphomyrmex costatus]|uniref:zinc finger protein 195-like n=1 Tax=Cyphomyrmex costatus TaxID=456900 RepID=UPI0008521F0E|nr:PREDICTED: zinc finger protein 195-like [Cyphomyrmex costatus]